MSAGAFERVFAPELAGLYAAARRYVRSTADAEDLVQDTMLKAFRGFDPAAPPDNPRAWLHRVLRNAAIDRARARGRQPDQLSIEDERGGLFERLQAGVETGQYSDPIRLISRWQDAAAVRAVFERLSEPAREVLVLAEVGGLSRAEMAEVLGVPEGTVMSRLARARRAFETRFAEHLELPEMPASGDERMAGRP